MKKNKLITFFFPSLIVLLLIVGIVIFPTESIIAAKNGFSIWVNTLIPSLLPFIIAANLIVSLKFVDILGLFINPLTKKLFNVSGKSALVFAISTVSGYPIGAKLASELRNNNEISRYESQRLVSFCSTSGPLFMVGAVAIGMFNNPSIGYIILICHYLGSLTVGILFRSYGKESISSKKLVLSNEIDKVICDRNKDNRGFFVLFGDAVYSGVNTMLAVGGFVIVFSVVFKILSIFNFIELVASIIHIPLSLIGMSKELCYAFISGLFEITIGCSQVSSITTTPELLRVALCSFIIAFSGLSILAQCCSFLAKTDIKTTTYIFSKLLHGIFSFLFTFIIYPLSKSDGLISAFNVIYGVIYDNSIWNYYISNYQIILPLLILIYLVATYFIMRNDNKKANY